MTYKMNKHICRVGLGEEGHGVNLHLCKQKLFSKKYITFIAPFKAFPKSIFWPLEMPYVKLSILHNVVGPAYNFKNPVLP